MVEQQSAHRAILPRGKSRAEPPAIQPPNAGFALENPAEKISFAALGKEVHHLFVLALVHEVAVGVLEPAYRELIFRKPEAIFELAHTLFQRLQFFVGHESPLWDTVNAGRWSSCVRAESN